MGATQPTASPLVMEERAGAVATIRLNRPEKLNALNIQLAQELVQALLRVQGDKSIHCVVITGAGRAFCAGGDLELLRDARKRKAVAEVEALVQAGKEIAVAIATMPKIVIAAVNGPAAGGGMNLALAADIRIASDQARFAESFAQIGLFPDFGGTYFLPRIVGPARAAELFYTATDALRGRCAAHGNRYAGGAGGAVRGRNEKACRKYCERRGPGATRCEAPNDHRATERAGGRFGRRDSPADTLL